MSSSKVEEISFYSEMLEKEMGMMVYLPEDYDEGSAYPVLYFLHGRSGNENFMFDIGLHAVADAMIQKGEMKPMIMVCPNMDNSRGINSSMEYKELLDPYNRTIHVGRYEDYLLEEVVPLVDEKFKTIKDRSGRFIGGASAGGYAALHQAFRHQDLFSKVGGHMPAIELKLEKEDEAYFSDEKVWKKYDPIHIASNSELSLDVYLDAGDEDEGGFFEGCLQLHKLLQEKEVRSQNYVFPGHHNAEYIKSNLEKYLKFYGS